MLLLYFFYKTIFRRHANPLFLFTIFDAASERLNPEIEQ